MGALTYFLCALTAFACASLLWRSWRGTRVGLLFWSALCFIGLTGANVLLVVDKLFLPDVDLTQLRSTVILCALLLLIFGLVWEDER